MQSLLGRLFGSKTSLPTAASANTTLLELLDGDLKSTPTASSTEAETLSWTHVTLSLQRTDQLYQYQLIASEANNDEAEELCFLIDVAMQWHQNDTKSTFSWLALDEHGIKVSYTYHLKNVTQEQVELFQMGVLQCIYERMTQQPHSKATDEELLALSRPKVTAASTASTSTPDKALMEGQLIFKSAEAAFYWFDLRQQQFVLQDAHVTAFIYSSQPFQYHLIVQSNQTKTIFLTQLIDSRLNQSTLRPEISFQWCFQHGENAWSVCLRFTSVEQGLLPLSRAVGRCLYETLNEESFDKLKNGDDEYILRGYVDDVEMRDATQDDESDDKESEENEKKDDSSSDENENNSGRKIRSGSRPRVRGESSSEDDEKVDDAKHSNRQLAIGYKHGRSFVLRGDSIGVFRHTDDDHLEFQTNIKNVADLKGNTFEPTKMMLHQEDSAVVMMHPTEKQKLFRLDLERGQVVEEWQVDDTMQVNNILPEQKYAQMTGTRTFIGHSHNAVFRVDPRLSGAKRVESESMQYVTKNDFSCAATTGQGALAVASNKGDIRLFNRLGIRAKTHLQGMGDPILGLDVTENGKYVLATCKTYLMLLSTEVEGEAKSGYEKSMGSNKPVPMRLQLKAEHAAFMQPVSFTPAHFNTGSLERMIVTSTGSYVITWNLRRVLADHLNDYTVKQYTNDVVADNFRYGQDRSIVVAMPHNVTTVSKSQLTNQVVTPSKQRQVKAPFL